MGDGNDFARLCIQFDEFCSAAEILRSRLKDFNAARDIEQDIDHMSLSDLADTVNMIKQIRR